MMVVYADASVKSYQGAGIGWHIGYSNDSNSLVETVDKGYDSLSGGYKSEEAELLAITRGVKEALRHGERSQIKLRTDCKPLVDKVINKTEIRDGKYMNALHNLLDSVDHWEIEWVPRSENNCADRHATVGLDQCA